MIDDMLSWTLGTALVNGSFITVNAGNEVNEAVGIEENRIAYVASSRDITPFVSKDTRTIDLHGSTLLIPGIIGTHFHLILNSLLGTPPASGIIDATKKNYDLLKPIDPTDIRKLEVD